MGWCEGWDANVDGAATGTLIDLTDTLTGADAVFGGHTHQQFASMVLGRPVVQVPNSGQMYSRVIIRLDTVSGAPVGSSVDFVTKAALAVVAPESGNACARCRISGSTRGEARRDCRYGVRCLA